MNPFTGMIQEQNKIKIINIKIMEQIKRKYLITTDEWFTAPDGLQYKAAWGEVFTDDLKRLKLDRFLNIGGRKNYILIIGSQVKFAIKCENKPNTEVAKDWIADASKINNFYRPSHIYIAE